MYPAVHPHAPLFSLRQLYCLVRPNLAVQTKPKLSRKFSVRGLRILGLIIGNITESVCGELSSGYLHANHLVHVRSLPVS